MCRRRHARMVLSKALDDERFAGYIEEFNGFGELVTGPLWPVPSDFKVTIRSPPLRSKETAMPCNRSCGAMRRNSLPNAPIDLGQFGPIPLPTVFMMPLYSSAGLQDRFIPCRAMERKTDATGESSSSPSLASLRLSL